jgi:uncharacterized repeat protein (TIGR02543 family)
MQIPGALKTVGMLLAGALLLAGCSDMLRLQQDSRGGGNAGIALQQVPDDVNEISLSVRASDMETQRETISVGSSSMSLEVPPGPDRTFRAQAGDYTARVTTDVPPSGTTVRLQLNVLSDLSVNSGNGEVAFTWSDPPDTDLNQVEISWDPADDRQQPITVSPGEETATVTGLTNGTEYTFTVKAIYDGGNASAGATVRAKPAVEYTVTYNANGATSGTAPADQTKIAGTDLTLATNSAGLARDGFTFAGWNTASDGSGESYAAGETYGTDADLTLYAEWTYLEYNIGDTGPAGGTIFYDDEDDGTDDIAGARYLEVAPASTEWTDIEWGDLGTEIGGDAQLTGIGDGRAATDAIVAHMEGKSITGSPAQRADTLSEGGYSDWFLPSKDELDLMLNVNGGFDLNTFWSSSEDTQDNAWAQFKGGNSNILTKNNNKHVRAIRAF